MLALEGPLGSGKTQRLLEETLRLLETQPSGSILVLCGNHFRQKHFQTALLTALTPKQWAGGQLPVYTYAGFVRNTLFNHWPLVEAEIIPTIQAGSPTIRPVLSGLEDTELILKWLLASQKSENSQAFAEFSGNEKSLIKQLVRRLRLRSENRLTRADMSTRSQWLGEICQAETAQMEARFDRISYALRVLDSNKQLDVFHRLLNTNNLMGQGLVQQIKHLVVDDVDESTPAQQTLIHFLKPTLETLILAADPDGGSRRGYLNAYPAGWSAFKTDQIETLKREDAIFQTGQTLMKNWLATKNFQSLPACFTLDNSAVTRIDMIEGVVKTVTDRLLAGDQAGDLCLVLPKVDFLSLYQLTHRLKRLGIPVQVLSGTQRPVDNPLCRVFLLLLQWLNQERWEYPLSAWELKTVMAFVLQLSYSDQAELSDFVKACLENSQQLPPLGTLLLQNLPKAAQARYKEFMTVWQNARLLSFEDQLYLIFQKLIAPIASEQEKFRDLQQLISSYHRQRQIVEGLQALLPQALKDFDSLWLSQVKTGVVADTPDTPAQPDPEAVIIGTPQKIIDMEIRRKIQLWLDVSSREWARSDHAPLYHSWVHSALWDPNTAASDTALSEEFHAETIRTRAAHITRSLALLATDKIMAFSSDLDDQGFTQNGQFPERLITSDQPIVKPEAVQRAVLREDQRGLLSYQSGTMAITAVPGAGKTFVNVELILELVSRGLSADKILVLTYMDSAAQTLLGRVKKKLHGVSNKLPVISTIHSLAFRILTDNDHALRLGLAPDELTIIDEFRRDEILNDVAQRTLPESAASFVQWRKSLGTGITHAKMNRIMPIQLMAYLQSAPQNFRLSEFVVGYDAYAKTLHEAGYLDFDDLIIKAIYLLETYPDIRRQYQAQFEMIIEDEAQDSSRLLQRLIQLLGPDREHPNLIRTGDTNQSITTTFSSADTQVFRDFIDAAQTVVKMDHSSRCAPEIIALSNQWMTACGKHPELTQAFSPVAMIPVTDQNPSLLAPIQTQRFAEAIDEEAWLIDTVAQFKVSHPDASIAILLRSNEMVNHVTSRLQQAQIPAISLSNQLNATPVFRWLLIYLNLLASHGDPVKLLAAQTEFYEQAVLHHGLEHTADRRETMETIPIHRAAFLDKARSDSWLIQLYYDVLAAHADILSGDIPGLLIKMTDRLFSRVEDRSNGYLCSLMAREILDSHPGLAYCSPLELVINEFVAYERAWRSKRGFTELLGLYPEAFVQVMSLHKSKGQEFDIVLMPALQSRLFPDQSAMVRLKEEDKLIEALDQVKTNVRQEDYQARRKIEKIEEEARLVYVGLTRAKKALFLSCHQKAMNRYRRVEESQPAFAFTTIEAILKPVASHA